MAPVRAAWLSAAAYAGMFGFGIVMALLGAVLPVLSERLRFDLARAGDLFLAMNAAMLVVTLLLGPAIDRFGLKIVMIAAPLCTAAAVALIADAGQYSTLLWSVVLLGAGGGALNQATNTLIADLHEDSRKKSAALNLLGVFFGFGALFIPLTIGSLLASLGLGAILACALVLSLIPATISVVTRFPPARQAGGVRAGEVLRFVRDPLVLAFGVLLFFESGNEFTSGGYIATYLTRDLGTPVFAASYVLAGYWGAMMLARVALSRLLLRVRGEFLIQVSALGVAGSLVLLVFATALPQAALAAMLLGLCTAAIFPTVLGLAGTQYASHSGTVFGILIGIALAGGMTMPWLVGRLSAEHGIRAGLLVVAGGGLAIFCLQIVIGTLKRRRVLA